MAQTTDVKLRLFIEAVNNAGSQLQDIGSGLQKLGERARDAQGRFVSLGARGTEGADKLAAAMGRLKSRMEGLKSAGQALSSIGTQLSIFGAAIAAAGAFPVMRAAQFEKAMNKVRAVTAGTKEEFREMEKVAQQLGATTKFTATQAAEGLTFLGMAGLSARQSIEALPPSLYLAASGGMELADAADIATNIMTGLALEAKDLTHITDVLANTAKNANTNVAQLGEAFSYVAGTVKEAGMSADEASAILGFMANAGVRASRAGTTLRTIILALNKLLPGAEKVFQRLQVEISKNADGTINYVKTLKDLRDSGATLTDFLEIFQKRGADVAAMLSRNVDGIDELTRANENAIGVNKEMAEQMEEGLVGALTKLKSAVDGLAQSVGKEALDSFTSFTLEAAKFLNKLTEWTDKHPEFGKSFTTLAIVVGGLTAAVAGLLVPIGLLLSMFGSIGAHLPVAILNFQKLTKASAVLRTVLLGVRSALGGLVIGGIIVGITTLIPKLIGWSRAAKEAKEANAELAESADKVLQSLKGYKDYSLVINIKTASPEQLREAEKDVKKAISYAEAEVAKAKTQLDVQFHFDFEAYRTGLTKSVGQAVDAWKEGKTTLDSLLGSWAAFRDVEGPMDAFREAQQAAIDAAVHIDKLETALKNYQYELVEIRKAQAKLDPSAQPQMTPEQQMLLEARLKVERKHQKMRIALMDESVEKIRASLKLELDEFEHSEELKTLDTDQQEAERALIRKKWAKEEENFLKEQAEARTQAELALTKAQLDAELEQLERLHELGIGKVEDYVEKKKEIVLAGYDAQIAALEQKLNEKGLTLEKKQIIELQIQTVKTQKVAAGEEVEGEGVELDRAKVEGERQLQQEIAAIRAEASGWEAERMQADLDAEMENLDERYWMMKQAGYDEDQLREWLTAQNEKREQKEKDIVKAGIDQKLGIVKTGLGYMESLFADMYEASGQEAKAFFYLQKAVSVADAIISTYAAANAAMKDTPGPGWVKQAMATMIIASGMARVAQIISTTIKAAEGGLIRLTTLTGAIGAGIPRFAEGGTIRLKGTKELKKITVPVIPMGGMTKGLDRMKSAVRPIGSPVLRLAEGGAAIPIGRPRPAPRTTRLPTKTSPTALMRTRPRKDKLPAWLTNREYIMSREAVRHYGAAFMEKVNQRKIRIEELVNKVRRRTEETKPSGETRTAFTRVISPVQRISEEIKPFFDVVRKRQEPTGRLPVLPAPIPIGQAPEERQETVRRRETKIQEQISKKRHKFIEFVDEIRKRREDTQPSREIHTAIRVVTPIRKISEEIEPVVSAIERMRQKGRETRPPGIIQPILSRPVTPLQKLINTIEPSRRMEKPRGGQVRGKSGIDKIPAWLQDEEFVIRAEAVRHYGVAFMELLNRRMVNFNQAMRSYGQVSRPPIYAEHFQRGGYVGDASPPAGTTGVGGSTTINVPVEIAAGGNADLAVLVQDTVETALEEMLKEYM